MLGDAVKRVPQIENEAVQLSDGVDAAVLRQHFGRLVAELDDVHQLGAQILQDAAATLLVGGDCLQYFPTLDDLLDLAHVARN